MSSKEPSPQEVLKYDGLRRRVAARVKAMGQGTQAAISYELKVPASQVSNALAGKYVHPAFLNRLAEWLESKTTEAPTETLPQA